MLSFASDYTEGACEEILQKLAETNRESLPGYGMDRYCQSAARKIQEATGCPEAEVYFLVGGTQTNAVVISSMLAPYEGVVAAQTGHVSIHEAGAIEYTGHKVLQLPEKDGKIDPADLQEYLQNFEADANNDHMVFPGMVYLSHPTEYGTLYSRKELQAISEICRSYEIPLYLDGARLGYGLAGEKNDLSLSEIAHLCDVFYIGGTKVGAFCGEAVVFGEKKNVPAHFITRIKQQGALLAKGRLLGIQFDVLFTDGLYERLGRHAVEMAAALKKGLKQRGYTFFRESPTNQQFVILENDRMEQIEKEVSVSFWERYDEDHTVHEIHNCKIEAFVELIESLRGKPALVFYNYQHDRTRILKALEKMQLRVRELKTTQDEDDWNTGKIDVLLTHPASSAYGLNLQQGGNHVIWFGLTWNYELYTQANKRLHRQGQQEKVIIHHLVSSGTRDEDVMQALQRKDDVQNWVMESLKARIRKIREEAK